MVSSEERSSVHARYIGLKPRLGAFLLDFLIIGGYILILAGAGFGLNTLTGGIPWLVSPIAMNTLSFLTLVLPVVLYFTLQERSSFQATWGKRRAGIKVVDCQGRRIGLWRALLRSVIKFLPWQLAHTSVIAIWFGSLSPLFPFLAYLSEGLVAIYVILLWVGKNHRPPYDWIAGTCVVLKE